MEKNKTNRIFTQIDDISRLRQSAQKRKWICMLGGGGEDV